MGRRGPRRATNDRRPHQQPATDAAPPPRTKGRSAKEPALSKLLAAAVQMTSTADVERNLAIAESLVAEAAARGARFVGLPENFVFLRSEGEPATEAQTLDGPWVQRMAATARRHEITLLLGSLPNGSWAIAVSTTRPCPG